MTDTKLLRDMIASKGLKYRFIADELNISPYGFQRKAENDSEFKASEIKKLTEILGLTIEEKERIFFV